MATNPHSCVAIRDGIPIVLTTSKPSKINQNPDTWGEHIKKKRLELGLRQRNIARILGCDTTTVHNWEIGKTKPILKLIPQLINFLGYVPNLLPTQTLGQKIIAYRMTRGLSQKELARRIGIDPSTLRRREMGKILSKGKWEGKYNTLMGSL